MVPALDGRDGDGPRRRWCQRSMGAMVMGRVGDGASARWGATAMERDGDGPRRLVSDGALVSMGATAMGRVGNGASARWARRRWAASAMVPVIIRQINAPPQVPT